MSGNDSLLETGDTGSTPLAIGSIEVTLDQVPSEDIVSTVFNAPSGLEVGHEGTILVVDPGTVMGDDNTLFRINESTRKDLTELFEPGAGAGCLAFGETFGDGVWYVYIVSNKTASDIFLSQSLEPTFPFYATKPSEVAPEDWYSSNAQKFLYGYRIGSIKVENGAISAYPSKDLAHAYIDNEFVFNKDFNAHIAQNNEKFAEVDAAIAHEEEARTEADSALDTKIDESVTTLNDRIEDEVEALDAEDARLDAKITSTANSVRREFADADTQLEDEFQTALAEAETALQGYTDEHILPVATAVSALDDRLESAEASLTQEITHDRDAAITAAVEAEAGARAVSEAALESSVRTYAKGYADELDSHVVHKEGQEIITGTKAFTGGLTTLANISPESHDTTVPNTRWVDSKVSALRTALTDKVDAVEAEVGALDSTVDGIDAAVSGLITETSDISTRVSPTFNDVSFDGEHGIITFTRDNGEVATINLPVDLVVKRGYYDPGTKQLVLVLTDGSVVHIDAADLVDEYNAGNGLRLTNQTFSVNTADTSVVDTAVTANSNKLVQSGAVFTSIEEARTALQTAIDNIISPSSPTSIEARLSNVETAVAAMGAIVLKENHHVLGIEVEVPNTGD